MRMSYPTTLHAHVGSQLDVFRAQELLGFARPDGIWGPKSKARFLASSLRSREAVASEFVGPIRVDIESGELFSMDPSGWVSAYQQIALHERVPPDFVRKVVAIESGGNPAAVSPTGYVGLMQLGAQAMDSVASMNPVGVRWTTDRKGRRVLADAYDQRSNLTVGTRYLRWISIQLAVDISDRVAVYAAYNLGISGYRRLLAGKGMFPELAANSGLGTSREAYLSEVSRRLG